MQKTERRACPRSDRPSEASEDHSRSQICREEDRHPFLLGPTDKIARIAAELDISGGIETIDHWHHPKLDDYVQAYWEKRTAWSHPESARRTMKRSNYFVNDGGTRRRRRDRAGSLGYPDTIRPALVFIGTRPEVRRVAGAYLIILEDKVKIFEHDGEHRPLRRGPRRDRDRDR